jgi:hypothetical protein
MTGADVSGVSAETPAAAGNRTVITLAPPAPARTGFRVSAETPSADTMLLPESAEPQVLAERFER